MAKKGLEFTKKKNKVKTLKTASFLVNLCLHPIETSRKNIAALKKSLLRTQSEVTFDFCLKT